MDKQQSVQRDVLLAELERRWRAGFASLAHGDDLPPGQRYRMEGMMESAALLAPGTESDITAAMAVMYMAVFGKTLAQDFGEDWQHFYPFPQIPAMMRRAPVYPSTAD